MRYIIYLILLTTSSHVFSQNLQGKVIDVVTGDDIPFASVNIVGTNISTISNENGFFVIKTPSVPLKLGLVM